MTELEPTAEDPARLFEEYVQRIDAEPGLPVEPLLARAGARRDELQEFIDLYGRMEGLRHGTTGAGLPDDLDAALVNGNGAGGVTALPDGQDTLGRFERLALIGEGGLSRVYVAHDTKLGRSVALKVLHTQYLDGAGARNWVLNEGRSLARLEHRGVVRVFDVGDIDGVAFIAMEHVSGPSLRDVLRCLRELAGRPEKDAPPVTAEARVAAARLRSVASRCELVASIAEALAYCHGHGVIHRDIKPANVLLADGRQPRLIDFGLAHLETTDALATEITQKLVGTPAYIAPEQVDNNRTGASERSDQFALGVLLVELLSLRNPFARDTRTETLDAISRAEPPRPRELDPTISEDLERICVHALERDAKDRYPDVAALAADLRAFLEHRAISLRAPTPAMLVGLWARRHRSVLRRAAAIVALGLAAAVGLRSMELRTARDALSAQVAGIVEALPQRSQPAEFQASYRGLDNLRRQAAELDASLLAGPFFAPLEPAVGAALDACSRRVSELFAERLAAVAPGDTDADMDTESENRTTDLFQQWAPVLRQDAIVCPECPHNREAAARGTIELPASSPTREVRLLRHGTLPKFLVATTFEPVTDTVDLVPGFYRLIVRDLPAAGGGAAEGLASVREREFTLRFAAPRVAIDARAMPAALRDTLMACPGGTIGLVNNLAATDPPLDVEVEPFLIARRPITWQDIGTVWGATKRDDLFNTYRAVLQGGIVKGFDPDITLEDPAVLNWRRAAQFAADCGARLPTAMEWRAAFQLPGFITPGNAKVAVGEWTSVFSYDIQNGRGRIVYARQADRVCTSWAGFSMETGQSSGTTFRLARSSP